MEAAVVKEAQVGAAVVGAAVVGAAVVPEAEVGAAVVGAAVVPEAEVGAAVVPEAGLVYRSYPGSFTTFDTTSFFNQHWSRVWLLLKPLH